MATTPVTRAKRAPITPQQEQQYLRDLSNNALEVASIGGCSLWLYPDLRYHTERYISEQATLGTWGVYDWGVMPYEFTLQGTTGIAGIHKLDTDKDSMRTFRPLFKTGFDLVDFRYPARFPGARKVRVLTMEDSITSVNKFWWYTITLKEYPSYQSSYRKVSTVSNPTTSQSSVNGALTRYRGVQ